jgi:hypothetical protein
LTRFELTLGLEKGAPAGRLLESRAQPVERFATLQQLLSGRGWTSEAKQAPVYWNIATEVADYLKGLSDLVTIILRRTPL